MLRFIEFAGIAFSRLTRPVRLVDCDFEPSRRPVRSQTVTWTLSCQNSPYPGIRQQILRHDNSMQVNKVRKCCCEEYCSDNFPRPVSSPVADHIFQPSGGVRKGKSGLIWHRVPQSPKSFDTNMNLHPHSPIMKISDSGHVAWVLLLN